MPASARRPVLSRRGFVGAVGACAAGWVLGGCTSGRPETDRDPEPTLGPGPDAAPTVEDPDLAVLSAATAVVDDLIGLCERAVASRRGVAGVVRPLLAVHRRHAEVLGAADGSAGSGTAQRRTSPPSLPRSRRRVLSVLAAAERRGAATHLTHVRRAQSGQFAQLLASISAAESQHAAVLTEATNP